MSLLASLLVNAVIAAAPATPLPWYTFDDYPQKAFDREWKGAATFDVLVAPDGSPTNCTITHSTGYDVLDRQTCWVAMHRARFTPARGPDGAQVYGVYRSQVVWHRPDQERLQRDPGPDDQRHVDAIIGASMRERVRWVLLTHTHPDHAPGTARLVAATGAEVLAFSKRERDAR